MSSNSDVSCGAFLESPHSLLLVPQFLLIPLLNQLQMLVAVNERMGDKCLKTI